MPTVWAHFTIYGRSVSFSLSGGYRMKKVAFICVHNSCRSQIAEALGKKLAADVFDSYSAGTEIKDHINPDAVRIMKKLHDVDMEKTQYSKLITDIPKPDVAISMGCNVACPYVGRPFDDNWGLDDPTGKSDMRKMLSKEEVAHNKAEVKELVKRFVRTDGDNPAIIVDNADWIMDQTYVDFMRDIGVHFNVNNMLSAECYKKRLEQGGLTFLEMGYMLMQAFDFVHLNKEFNCKLQIGGSDQWGNLTSGLELIRKVEGVEAKAEATLRTSLQDSKTNFANLKNDYEILVQAKNDSEEYIKNKGYLQGKKPIFSIFSLL